MPEKDQDDPSSNFPGRVQGRKPVEALYHRPRYRDQPRRLNANPQRWQPLLTRRHLSDRKGLPMVCLVRPDGPQSLLSDIQELLSTATPHGVRHAYLPLSADDSDGTPITGPKTWTP